jgi:cytochrome c'
MMSPKALLRLVPATAAFVAVVSLQWPLAQAAPADKSPIKEIMNQANKGDDSLFKKVEAGNGTKEDKAKLLALFTDLAKYDPPRGDKRGWQTKTAALVKAAQAVNDNAAGAIALLTTANNCKNCHSAYKPPKGR